MVQDPSSRWTRGPLLDSLLARVIPILAAAIVLLAGAPAPRAQVVGLGAVSSFTLDNGLQVVVIPDHRLPVATHMVWYRVGAADETAGSSGLAHLVEHLMFKTCNAAHVDSFSQIVSRLGGLDNAFTDHDTTHYVQRLPVERLRHVMELEAQRMARLSAGEEETLSERKVVVEERRSNVESDPVKILNEQMMAALYQNHRYGVPAVGWAHEIETLTREQAVAFHRRHYGPNNAIVVIAGDVTVDNIRALVGETYAKVARNDAIVPMSRTREPQPLAARRLTMVDSRAARPALFRYYLAPSYVTSSDRAAESIDLLMRIIGSGATSRLTRALVTRRKVASVTGATYFGNTRNDGRIAIFAVAGSGQELANLEAALDDVLSEVVKNGVTAEELNQAKRAYKTGLVFQSDNQQKLAERYGEGLAVGRTLEDIARQPERVTAVTVEDVNSAARRFLALRRSVTGLLLRDQNGSTE